MRLLQLNATCNWGSTGRIAEGIADAASCRGWECATAYGRSACPSSHAMWRVGSYPGVLAHYAAGRLLDREGLQSARATRDLVSRIRHFAPDIIHLHNIHDHWLNYPVLSEYLKSSDVPVVWTFHDCWAFTGHCPHFVGVGCDKWQDGCHHCPYHGRDRLQLRDASAANYARKKGLFQALGPRLHIVTPSLWLEGLVAGSFLKECPRRTIHNGVDTSVFRPSGEKAPRKLLLAVANVWPAYKGLDDLCRLRQLLPQEEYDMTIVGLSPDQAKGLPPGITGMGRTASAHELAGLYSRAHAFVNASHSDTFPTTNLEALACGTPVVTYPTGGSPEAVDALTGLVTAGHDPAQLARAVAAIGREPGRHTPGQCRQRALAEFDRQRQYGRYADLYEEILRR